MRLTVSVPDLVAEQVRTLAAQTGQSVSSVVAAAVERHVAAERRRLAADRIQALIGTATVSDEADAVLREMRRTSDRDLA